MTLKKFEFHYTPTGTGVISGPEVLKQTEDAINEIGEYADNASDNSEEALNIAKEARTTAQTANSTSSNALAVANSANEKVETLKQVVDDWDADIQLSISNSTSALTASSQAIQTANTAVTSSNEAKTSALTSAQTAQSALNSALQAQNSAESAQNSAETAQNLAETAQQQAQSAKEAAETAQANAYAVRTIDSDLSISQTINIADLKPQGNIKVGDTVVGTDGRMFTLVSIDTTAGTAVTSSTWVDLTPNVSYSSTQSLTETEQTTARNNIGFNTGIDNYLCPILEELILENGGTQEEIDKIINGTDTESETETGT
ncbi:cell shape-determining protein MreD [Burkholderiales bacterium YL45]|uniref:Cell shape-determining protein MreD n=1 Tax=Turicimonas muris TaxID=1796652 RepID=A0A227KQP1_9BURK|nr:alanine-zipper protein [Turicimonas muris]ANU65047.1 cell shape-determining protein MreD [Burkholderiales bacterium YL45]OXE50849.1 cell shape-determining protein MreD [Turicimonas muris]QQQ96209.1 cell shape-determining protein MreD [Turicimonas muris]